jgi:iron(II)-dependent oxidoreductase
MGSGEDDSDAKDNEKPLHQLDMPYGYWMGEYPITNAQFMQFMAAGGYAEAAFWPEAIHHRY